GSGVIISDQGHIITNYHVIGDLKENNGEVRVVFADESELSGADVEFVAGDEIIDLAILKINLETYKGTVRPIRWGNSDTLRIGEAVAAVGSPLDLRLSITRGIVAA